MYDVALIAVVSVHLLAVNLAGGGPIVAALGEWRGTRRDSPAAQLAARQVARWSIAAAVVGMALGLAALGALTVWSPQADATYAQALRQVPVGRWWFTAVEIGFYFACMGAYVAAWDWFARARWVHRVIALAAATNLLYHFPALFTILSLVDTRPELAGQTLDSSLFKRLLLEPETLARIAHVWLASLTVGGLALSAAALRLPEQFGDERRRAAIFGGRCAVAATLSQVPVGVWILLAMPGRQQDRVLGGEMLSTLLMGSGIFAAIALLWQLALLALGDVTRRRVRFACGLLAVVVALMTATLHWSRA